MMTQRVASVRSEHGGSPSSPYEVDLDRSAANFRPMTPLHFLKRSAEVYPQKVAVAHGQTTFSYAEFYSRCRRFASALVRRGIGRGDTVSVMAPNVPALLEAHFAVPMAGAVLNSLNYRLDAKALAFCLDHGESKLLVADREFSETVAAALALLEKPPAVIDIDDPELAGAGKLLGESDYETFLEGGDPGFEWSGPADEWDALCLLYTSGTTGDPKGVVYHHRGAYLNALGNALMFGFRPDTIYLWTLPMFHCSGWSHSWGVTAVGGTHVCLRRVDSAEIFTTIARRRVTHLVGAPIVLNMLVNAPDTVKLRFDHTVEIATGGASPPSTVIAAMEAMNFRVTHLYGATETYGPSAICAWQPEWDALDLAQRAEMMARQGVAFPTVDDMMVAQPGSTTPVPRDGATMGEIMVRGNTVMKGYLKNRAATAATLKDGWYRSGDLAVWHPDGYVEIKDRSKDIIISGGENISSLEVEEVLYKHPAVLEAAVVARPDEKWGETPCAFVTVKPGAGEVSDKEIIAFCRANMARFKVPKTVVFGPLPKTSTGKIQKFELRRMAKEL
jgi:fatty-acyl-CoA synthase